MMCANPFMQGEMAFGCGQCWHCRVNRERQWQARMELEMASHEFNCFYTMTYDEEHLPSVCCCPSCSGNHPTGTLRPKDLQLFLKRLRFELAKVDRKFRFFAVGEYGHVKDEFTGLDKKKMAPEDIKRPHYHMILFGVSQLETPLLDRCWGKGITYMGEANNFTSRYCTGYMQKRHVKEDNVLLGRHPEFQRMSLRPGIGGYAADDIGNQMTTKQGSYLQIANQGDAPSEIIIGGKRKPVHRYIKARIRRRLGVPEPGIGSPSCQAAAARLQALLGAAAHLPSEEKRVALLNKTDHLRKRRQRLYQMYQRQQKGKVL